MGRVGQLVVGYALMVAGVLTAAFGAFAIWLGGEGGQDDHPYAGFGVVVVVIGVAAVAFGLFVVHSVRHDKPL